MLPVTHKLMISPQPRLSGVQIITLACSLLAGQQHHVRVDAGASLSVPKVHPDALGHRGHAPCCSCLLCYTGPPRGSRTLRLSVKSQFSGTADDALKLLAVSDFSQAEAVHKTDCCLMALSCDIYRLDCGTDESSFQGAAARALRK